MKADLFSYSDNNFDFLVNYSFSVLIFIFSVFLIFCNFDKRVYFFYSFYEYRFFYAVFILIIMFVKFYYGIVFLTVSSIFFGLFNIVSFLGEKCFRCNRFGAE